MVYVVNPVNKSGPIRQSSGPIRTNFRDYSNAFNVNHIDINDGVGPGKHFKLDMPFIPQNIVVGAEELTLFSAKVQNDLLLYLGWDNGTGVKTMTRGFRAGNAENDEAFFRDPSGSIIKFGTLFSQAPLGSSTHTVTFVVDDLTPAFSTIPLVVLVPLFNTEISYAVQNVTTLGFEVKTNLPVSAILESPAISFIAIGT